MMKEKAKEETRELRTVREAHIMMLLRHPHIVQLKNLVAAGPYFYILMDYVNGGQLLHYIVKREKLSEHHSRHFSRQIVSALDYMHRNSIVHRDLKIENILIDKAGENIKIIDFGLSNLFCPERRLTTYCGSLYFAAPELLRATPYRGPEIDVWSLGVVIYVMVTGSVPFDDKSMPGLHDKIKRGQVAYPAHLTSDCKDLLSRIFVTDPTKRILLADVLRHGWINQGYKRIIKSYLPLRLPIAPPLAPHILQHMTRGFNMGTAEDIRVKMEMIIKSPVYRSAAEHVARLQANNASAIATTDGTTTVNNNEESKWGEYDDPQTVPAAYHPLLSIYHLTRERLSHQEIEQESDSPIDNAMALKPMTPPLSPIITTSNHDQNCSSSSSGYPRNELEFDEQEEEYDDDEEEEEDEEDYEGVLLERRTTRRREKDGRPSFNSMHETFITAATSTPHLSPDSSHATTTEVPPLLSMSSSISTTSSANLKEFLISSTLDPTNTINTTTLPSASATATRNTTNKKKPSLLNTILHRSTTSLSAIFAKWTCTQ
jgi:serine/threonine protein kinase